MAKPIVSQCPFCHGPTEVTELSCPQCDVQMRGHFSVSRYGTLAPEQQQFLETFLRCRGVIRDVEAALGISYPTVRARLDGMLSALGFGDGPVTVPPPAAVTPTVDKAAKRKEILEAISAGRMDAQAGLDALQILSD